MRRMTFTPLRNDQEITERTAIALLRDHVVARVAQRRGDVLRRPARLGRVTPAARPQRRGHHRAVKP